VRSNRLLVSVLITTQLAYGGAFIMPMLVGAFIDGRGLDPAAAGLLGSGELLGLALASIALAGFVARGSRRRWVMGGLALAAIGHGFSALVTSYEGLLVARILAGVGEGALLATGNAVAASADDPERLFAKVGVVQGLLGASMIAGTPYVIGTFGPEGAFAGLVLLTLGLAPWALWVPNAPPRDADSAPREASPNRSIAMRAITGFFLMAVAQSAVWIFSERLGLLAGLSGERIGVVLAFGSMAAMPGSALAMWLGSRAGYLLPVAVGSFAYVALALVLVHVHVPSAFMSANVGFGIAFYFMWPYIMGSLAALDRGGRWTATAGGVASVGAAAGPVVGGLLLSFGWGAISLLLVVITPVFVFMLLPALRKAEADEREAVPAAVPAGERPQAP
jgi:predicted MFS family arabinose efflux permease